MPLLLMRFFFLDKADLRYKDFRCSFGSFAARSDVRYLVSSVLDSGANLLSHDWNKNADVCPPERIYYVCKVSCILGKPNIHHFYQFVKTRGKEYPYPFSAAIRTQGFTHELTVKTRLASRENAKEKPLPTSGYVCIVSHQKSS